MKNNKNKTEKNNIIEKACLFGGKKKVVFPERSERMERCLAALHLSCFNAGRLENSSRRWAQVSARREGNNTHLNHGKERDDRKREGMRDGGVDGDRRRERGGRSERDQKEGR